MTTQTKSAQNSEQTNAQATQKKIYLEHRLTDALGYDTSSYTALADAVDSMTDRARDVLIMLSSQFLKADNRLNDKIIYNVIDSAIKEIDDIKIVVTAYHETQVICRGVK